MLAQRKRKYGNTPVVLDGFKFSSKAEAKRYGELKLLERGGEIAGLRLHTSYPLVATSPWLRGKGMNVGSYVDDFSYELQGERVVEDVKGCKTAVYRLKKKLVKALYGIDVTEIDA